MTATTALDQARQEKNAWKARAQIAEADRDRARTIAVHLEQENAELRAVLAQVGIYERGGEYFKIVAEHGPELVNFDG